ncbi:hypothetical protein OSB04_012421 [Centaurea solstitialis]|uniref:Retrovirus-related Pol polyprotein from transposon TNT 1-94 n=1 Tax=Centaurea solstitialis TaxID=347529 RepID=A0AA38WEK6_9ASTR|nr:hypothetical protein OSB04_012421 [Centaurea solstitialis]
MSSRRVVVQGSLDENSTGGLWLYHVGLLGWVEIFNPINKWVEPEPNPTRPIYTPNTMHWIPIYCDSSSAVQIAANPVQHSRTKHIDIRYHFIKDHVEKGNVELFFVESERQIADLFTKAFDEKRHYYLLSKLGMLDPPTDF